MGEQVFVSCCVLIIVHMPRDLQTNDYEGIFINQSQDLLIEFL